jgi:hypothetical protein
VLGTAISNCHDVDGVAHTWPRHNKDDGQQCCVPELSYLLIYILVKSGYLQTGILESKGNEMKYIFADYVT